MYVLVPIEKKNDACTNWAALFWTNTFESCYLFGSCSTPPFPVITGVVSAESSGEERFISKWLPKTQSHLYADEINIDALPPSCCVLPNSCQHSYITCVRYNYQQAVALMIWQIYSKWWSRADGQAALNSPLERQINEAKWHRQERVPRLGIQNVKAQNLQWAISVG